MEEVKVAAVEIGHDGDTSRIVEEMLSGCRSAGARTRHLVVTDAVQSRPESCADGFETVVTPHEIPSSVDTLADSDHIIMGVSASAAERTEARGTFRAECYRRARWMSLADVIGKYGARVRMSPGASPADFRFPLPRRELSVAHRGLVVFSPPWEIPDHTDPFCENSFFVLEELMRILGFMPQGRILATGLYYPPLEENPMLKDQAFELGRHLVAGGVVAGGGRPRG
jgi:hypothetical protein